MKYYELIPELDGSDSNPDLPAAALLVPRRFIEVGGTKVCCAVYGPRPPRVTTAGEVRLSASPVPRQSEDEGEVGRKKQRITL